MPRRLPSLLILLTLSSLAPLAAAQNSQFRLDEHGNWVPAAAPTLDPDSALIAKARQLLADNKPGEAISILDDWLDENEKSNSPALPQAYLIRADAKTAQGDDYKALYDYEAAIKGFPESQEFVLAVRRELDIAIKYVYGMKRRWLGMRIMPAEDVGEELLVRTQERLPGSPEAERAGIELADYYYRNRDLKEAGEAYQLFVENFPKSQHAARAREMRIYANIAQFKGPNYDASGLTEAKLLIEDFAASDPITAQREGLSDALIARLDESSAAQILQKARWYLARNDGVSARLVLQRVIAKHPKTVAARTAMEMLNERGWALSNSPAKPAAPAAAPDTPAPADQPAPTTAPAPTTPAASSTPAPKPSEPNP